VSNNTTHSSSSSSKKVKERYISVYNTPPFYGIFNKSCFIHPIVDGIYKYLANTYFYLNNFFNKKWDIYENIVIFDSTPEKNISKTDGFSLTCEELNMMEQSITNIRLKYQYLGLSECYLKYHLFILKSDDYYFTKIIYQSKPRITILPTNYEISNVKFMAIEYVHSSLKTPLLIDLSSYKFTVGSHILSFSFIYWYLRNKYGDWVDKIFDMNYKLNIVDQNCQVVQILPFNYIYMKEDEYDICKIFSLLHYKP
jgi:hypothetical protein